MLNIHKASIFFQGEPLFSDITFRLGNGNRVGLIGKNGAGKSTLLKVISGEIEASSGQIAKEKDVNIGFLKQDIDFEFGVSRYLKQLSKWSLTIPEACIKA